MIISQSFNLALYSHSELNCAVFIFVLVSHPPDWCKQFNLWRSIYIYKDFQIDKSPMYTYKTRNLLSSCKGFLISQLINLEYIFFLSEKKSHIVKTVCPPSWCLYKLRRKPSKEISHNMIKSRFCLNYTMLLKVCCIFI